MDNKKIALICDDERLIKVISLAFDRKSFDLILCDCPGLQHQDGSIDNLKLIIVALASPMSEPIVEISRAALGKFIGEVPILIVSQRRFHPAISQQIYHMDFPFDVNALKKQAEQIMAEVVTENLRIREDGSIS